MSEVFLHIGHGKTGSSYIQSVLNLSRERLLEKGFFYPLEEKDYVNPEKISSGNGRLIYDLNFDWLGAEKTVIFSDEHLFRMMCDGEYFRQLSIRFRDIGFDKVNVLLFTRDPVSHAASLYQQSIKRDGKFHPVETIFESYDTPKRVANFIEMLSCDDFFDITIINYSRNRGNLIGRLADWLGLCKREFVLPKKETINRSLTESELYFQSVFNRYLGKCSGLISDPLCELLPNVKSDVILPDYEVQMATIDRLRRYIDIVNERFPNEAYRSDMAEPERSVNLDKVLSKEQVDVLCESLAKRILEQRNIIVELRSRLKSS